MCCTCIFTCIMTMISNFPIICTVREFFLKFFFHKCNIVLHLDVILILLLLTVTSLSFQNQLYFQRALIEAQNFFIQSFPRYKYVCFLCDQMPKLLTLNIRKEYAHLFLLLKIFLDYLYINIFLQLKIKYQHK